MLQATYRDRKALIYSRTSRKRLRGVVAAGAYTIRPYWVKICFISIRWLKRALNIHWKSRNSSMLPTEKFLSPVLSRNAIMLQHYISNFRSIICPLVAYGRFKTKLQIFSSKSSRGCRLQEVSDIVIFWLRPYFLQRKNEKIMIWLEQFWSRENGVWYRFRKSKVSYNYVISDSVKLWHLSHS